MLKRAIALALFFFPMRYFLFFAVQAISTACFSQNLILNGNFELDPDSLCYHHWFSIGDLRGPRAKDAFTSINCLEDWGHFSSGRLWWSDTLSGNGVYFAEINIYPHREYIVARLCRALESNAVYNFKMSFRPHWYSRKVTSSIGAYFTDNLQYDSIYRWTGVKPDIVNDHKKFISEKKWYDLQGIYQAKGGERFIVIGNFEDNRHTHLKKIKGNKSDVISFFIDNVSLVAKDSASCNSQNVSLQAPLSTQSILDVNFEFDSYVLKRESFRVLDSLVTVLASNKRLGIRITGFTDSSGTADYNLKLSVKRAESVAAYLSAEGILPERIEADGKGEQEYQPELGSRNRRVEILFEKM